MPDLNAIAPHMPWALVAVAAVLTGAAGYRRGRRHREPGTGTPNRAQQRRDRALFIAAFGAATIVYATVIAGSFTNLAEWAGATLNWTGWERYIVPISLDGLGTAAGFLAFRAVRAETSPHLCYLMVWGATAASMAINAIQGGKHGGTAAFYMAFLSLAVMAMFHLFLGQFQAGAEYVGKKYPRFGLRWITYYQTPADFLCWVNHPPEPELEPTVANAIQHRIAWKDRQRQEAEAAAEAEHDRQLRQHQRAAELAAAEAEVAGPVVPEAEPVPEPAIRPATRPARRPARRGRATRQNRPAAKAETTAAAVARERMQNPGATQAQVAARLNKSERTVRNYWQADNVTPIYKEAQA